PVSLFRPLPLLLLLLVFARLRVALRLRGSGGLGGEAVHRAALDRVQLVDDPVAGEEEVAAVGDRGVVGAVLELEDLLAVGHAEAVGPGGLQVADVVDVADHAAGTGDGPARGLGPALAAVGRVPGVARPLVGAEVDGRGRVGGSRRGRRRVDVAARRMTPGDVARLLVEAVHRAARGSRVDVAERDCRGRVDAAIGPRLPHGLAGG